MNRYYDNLVIFLYMFLFILILALVSHVSMYLTKSRKDQTNDNTARENSTQN
jgi:hypothetical protein